MAGLRFSCAAAAALVLAAQAATFDVTNYGAKADGATDCAKAIQAAIDAAATAGGGTVLLPPADNPYLVRDTIQVRSSGIEIYAYGARILLADGAFNGQTKFVFFATGTETAPIRNVALRGLSVDANYFAQTNSKNSKAVVFRLVDDALVEDVRITRPYVGLSFRRCNNALARRVAVSNYSEDGLDAGGDADELPGGKASGITFTGIVVRDAPRAAHDGNGFEIEDGVEGVLIQDSLVENVSSNAVGLRNHKSRDNHSSNVELRNVTIRNVHGDFALFARSAPRDQAAVNSYSNIRLINVETEGAVAFYGPIRGLLLRGGQYGEIHLGFDSTSGKAKEALGLIEASLDGVRARLIRMNGSNGRIELASMAVDRIEATKP